MPAYRHLFVIDPIEKLNLKLDSSLRLAYALSKKQHPCFITTPSELYLRSSDDQTKTLAKVKAKPIRFNSELDSLEVDKALDEDLHSFQAVHIRKDPPFDMNYIAMTWVIDQVRGKAAIFNDTHALRNWNEKLIITRYPKDTQAVLYSCQSDDIERFVEEKCQGDAIFKPLDLYGGLGIERLKASEKTASELRRFIDEHTQASTQHRLVQPFNPSIHEGEVRVFCAGGTPIAWCLKKPRQGEFMANTRLGAELIDYKPSKEETTRVERIAKDLTHEGIFLTGFDLIGGYVSEINITSPRLLSVGPNEKEIYEQLADLICEQTEKVLSQT